MRLRESDNVKNEAQGMNDNRIENRQGFHPVGVETVVKNACAGCCRNYDFRRID